MVKIILNREIQELIEFYKTKRKLDPKESYTSYLVQNPDKLAEKINEESFEVIIEFLKKNKKKLITESADLIYHLFVTWIYNEIDAQEVWKELEKRKIQSGFQEKNKRKKNDL